VYDYSCAGCKHVCMIVLVLGVSMCVCSCGCLFIDMFESMKDCFHIPTYVQICVSISIHISVTSILYFCIYKKRTHFFLKNLSCQSSITKPSLYISGFPIKSLHAIIFSALIPHDCPPQPLYFTTVMPAEFRKEYR
jgi:hypothetical protein